MAEKSDARKRRDYCEPLADDIARLADLLDRIGACTDISPLTTAAATASAAHSEKWGYEIAKLIFPLEEAANPSVPLPISDLKCILDLSIRGPIPDDAAASLHDPCDVLALDLHLQAKIGSGATTEMAWHLDRHPDSKTEAAHPRYHWQCGGRRIKDFVRQAGFQQALPILFLESPRLAHPPLDAALAVDFVLSNFNPAGWQLLRTERSYRTIVTNAQRRLWRPYAAATRRWFSEHIALGEDAKDTWSAAEIWPHLPEKGNCGP